MKLLKFISFAIPSLFFASIASAQVVVLVEEDFEGAGARSLSTGNNGAALTEADDPEVGGTRGTVAAIDLGGTNQWGAVAPVPDSIIPLPAGTVPGTDTYTVTMDVYIPDATTFNALDSLDGINLILRFNDGVDNNSISTNLAINNPASGLPRNEWTTITAIEMTIPQFDRADPPGAVSHVVPILSFRDQDPLTTPTAGNEAGAGIAAYFDNFRLEVTVPDDDPNLAAAPLNFGANLDQGSGPHVQQLIVTNTGATQTLNITAAAVSGANADLFTVTNTTFPLAIDVGENAPIEVTFSPADGFGTFSGNLELTSDDQNDATVTVAMSGTVLEPFQGRELIINGDFETGDLSSWRDNDRFNYTEDQAHTGTGAAVFNLAGGQEWGEARTAIDPPTEPVNLIEITPEMIGKDYEYRAWYFRPSEGGMDPTDEVMTIFRWNGINAGNHTHGRTFVSNIPVDEWFRVVGTGVVPDMGGDGLATTSVVPLWSFHDIDSNAPGGELMYIDDVSFKVDVPPLIPDVDLAVTEIVRDDDAGVVRLTWRSIPGATYGIDRRTDLSGIWLEEVEDEPGAAGETTTWEDTAVIGLGGPRYFYRVRLVSLPGE